MDSTSDGTNGRSCRLLNGISFENATSLHQKLIYSWLLWYYPFFKMCAPLVFVAVAVKVLALAAGAMDEEEGKLIHEINEKVGNLLIPPNRHVSKKIILNMHKKRCASFARRSRYSTNTRVNFITTVWNIFTWKCHRNLWRPTSCKEAFRRSHANVFRMFLPLLFDKWMKYAYGSSGPNVQAQWIFAKGAIIGK